MFDAMGMWTWALIFSAVAALIGAMISFGGLVRQIVGAFIVSASIGTMVWIIAYRGYEFPGTNQPIGLMAGAAVLLLLGLGMLSNLFGENRGEQRGGSVRDRIPAVKSGLIIGVAFAMLFVILGGLYLYNGFDVKANNAGEGFNLFQDQFDRQYTSQLRRLERFLAR